MDALVCVQCLQDYSSLRLSQWRSRAKAPCRTLSVPSAFHSYACPQALSSGTAPARQDLVRQVCLAVLQKACTSTATHAQQLSADTPVTNAHPGARVCSRCRATCIHKERRQTPTIGDTAVHPPSSHASATPQQHDGHEPAA